jgi:hypothetical protein
MSQDPLARALALPGMFDAEAEEILRAAKGDRWYEAMRIAKMHAVVFDGDAGRVLLEHWIKVFLCRSIVRPNEDAFAQGIREGQANVIRQLLAQLEIARTGPGEPP